MRIEINAPWPRTTHQQRKFGNGHSYEPASLKAAREWWMWTLRPFAPNVMIDAPVSMYFMFGFKSKLRGPRTQRPDCDNLVKLPLDCMTRLGFWKDDSQIVRMEIVKCNTEYDCIEMRVEEMRHVHI